MVGNKVQTTHYVHSPERWYPVPVAPFRHPVVVLNMSLRQLLPGSADTDSTPVGEAELDSFVAGWMGGTEFKLWILTIVVMLADVLLTIHGLSLGLRERNPIARAAFESAGALGLSGLKLMAVTVGLTCRQLSPDRTTILVPLILLIPSALAVGINSALIAVTLK